MSYAIDPKRPYGPVWGAKRPPGLPAYARLCSTSAEGKKALRAYFEKAKTPAALVAVLLNLAAGESGYMLGRPADNFDARAKKERVDELGVLLALITAWGIFNWNAGCLQSETHDKRMPWDLSVEEEIGVAVRKYTKLWVELLAAGGTELDAGRGIRLWHALPSQYKKYLKRAKAGGFAASWAKVPNPYRSRIDHHLKGVGLSTTTSAPLTVSTPASESAPEAPAGKTDNFLKRAFNFLKGGDK